jgi:hypothetical protein
MAVLAALAVWPFALAAEEAAPDPARHLSLSSGRLDTATLGLETDVAAGPYALVKFPGPVTAEQYARLEAGAERIYAYVPYHAYLVKLPPTLTAKSAQNDLGAGWVGPYRPDYKVSPLISAMAASPLSAEALEAREIVMVQVFPDADLRAVEARIAELGVGEIVGARQSGYFSRIRLLAPRGQLLGACGALAEIPEVFWIDVEARRVLLNDTTIGVGQSGSVGLTPVFNEGIFGEGQVVGVLDTGIDPDMCYFRDPARGLPPINACNGGTVTDSAQRKVIAVDFLWGNECSGGISNGEWDTHDHGTHVAGTVAGDNFANPLLHDLGDGMATGAKLVIQDCGFSTDNCADCPGIGCPVVDLNPIFQQAFSQGARIHTNSWGDEENFPVKGRYTAGSQDADEFMWNHKEFLILFAAGNDGPGTGTVGSPSTGKNVVSVGATQRGSSSESMASFSSCGPTLDGRVKPDITIPGQGIVSANNDGNIATNNCGRRTMSGTSMASPAAAGLSALIRQYYTDGWYPTGDPVPSDGFTPSAALLKATLVNSGTDMANVAAIPSNCQGWGRVLLDDTLHFSGESRALFVEDDTAGFPTGSSGQERSFQLEVASGEPLKATLTWTDFPATPLADPTIVNDLDLVVTGPQATFLGNVFSNGASVPGGAADRNDTVEQVLIANPQSGTYTVTVRSFNVPAGPQPFALVVTGALSTGAPPPPPPPPGECLHEAAFGDAGGWTQGNDTCTTGDFVVGSPTLVTNGGVTTQPAGGAEGTTNAFFTAPNSSAGVDDVDGGTCEALSPLIDASGESAVEISLFYFHGQRDTGGDPSDGFTIEVLDDGQVVDTLVDVGDVTSHAAWTPVSTTLSNPGTLQIRVRATDGTASGDLVEGGIDSVRVCPSDGEPPPGGCTVDDDFESGAAGWSNDPASTCATGAYILGTPTEVVNGGVRTQVGGANSGVNAIFTAANSSAGVNDVDGGNCILRSPTFAVADASTLSVAYFHGQRDAGGDPGGDFFSLDVSTDGGATFSPIASAGDATSNAVWTNATTSIPAGSNVVLRVQCSDGPASGDLVECGIDDLSICR